jgi:hypothetical protein
MPVAHADADPAIWPTRLERWNVLFGDALEKDAWRVEPRVIDEKFSPAFTIAARAAARAVVWLLALPEQGALGRAAHRHGDGAAQGLWPTPSDAWQSTLVVTGFTSRSS